MVSSFVYIAVVCVFFKTADKQARQLMGRPRSQMVAFLGVVLLGLLAAISDAVPGKLS